MPLYASDYEVESLGGPSRKTYQGDIRAFISVDARSGYEDINPILIAEKKLLRVGRVS